MIGRYWHTLRHLRAEQIYGRVMHRLVRPRVDASPAPRQRAAGDRWVAPVAHTMSLTGPETHAFLGQERSLANGGWDDPHADKLWRYNLHYFDHLAAGASAEQREWQTALLSRWVRDNRPGRGTGWEPFPTSLRIVNWIKWALAGHALPPECVHSLATQARWLTQRLETHLLGNHLFANAKALVFAGLFFDGPEADGWLAGGLAILGCEVPEQILDDGGQFERSPMYHALAVEDMLDLVNVTATYQDAIPLIRRAAVTEWRTRARAMLAWMDAMCHPDGEIAFFNDAAIGIAPPPALLTAYARRLRIAVPAGAAPGVTSLQSSGYVRIAQGDAVALLDVAPVGPDYLPGHAHADTLSFELSLFGQRVLVNSGTSVYGTSAERVRQRGTAAHNTVVVDGADSSEVWSGFRVARRARPMGLRVEDGDPVVVECAHDGYTRLRRDVVHRRVWTMNERSMSVQDTVGGRVTRAESRLHVHPDVEVVAEDGAFVLLLAGGRTVRLACRTPRFRVERSTWHPRFGASLPNVCIAAELHEGRSIIDITWGAA